MRKTISRKEIIVKFRKLGFEGPFTGTRHQFMKKGRKKIRIPNPHGGKDIHIGLLKEILKQADISIEDWEDV
jgi:predicted RNA binding protein YcfA (HicA-like mRNA interferase family)